MGGIQITGLGMMGEYIGRDYMNLNQQPQYVIKEIRATHSHPSFEKDAGSKTVSRFKTI